MFKRRVGQQPRLCIVTKLRFCSGCKLDRATNERLIPENEASSYGSKADVQEFILFESAISEPRRKRSQLLK